MKRIASESKLPGMTATRSWDSPDNLSDEARRVGAAKRIAREDFERTMRQIESVEGLLRTVDRARRRKLK
jgi:hypothetical protein